MSILPFQDVRALNARRGTAADRAPGVDAIRTLLKQCGRILQVPVALLSHDSGGWRFEGGQIPPSRAPLGSDGRPWTGIPVGRAGKRDWVLLVPGSAEEWRKAFWLEEFVDQVRRSLERVTLEEGERQRRRLSGQVYAFSRRLARGIPPADLHQFILRVFAGAVGARTASLAIYNAHEDAFIIAATIGYPTAIVEHVMIPLGHGVIGQVALSRKARLGTAAGPHKRLRYRGDSFIAQPLVYADRTLAVVALTDKQGCAFDNDDLTATRMLAPPAALALSRERMHDSISELTRAATVDSVTGLSNRRYFEARLQAELQRARRQQQSLALMIVDIDDFKRINDTYGHLVGDRALRDVAELLRGGVRIFDDCARFGGEEFTILMPGATAEMALQAAERIRGRIEDSSRRDDLPITVSVGVAMLEDNETSDELIDAADRALIAAKQAGKNRVEMYR